MHWQPQYCIWKFNAKIYTDKLCHSNIHYSKHMILICMKTEIMKFKNILFTVQYCIQCTLYVQRLKIFSKKLKRCKSFSHCECSILDGLPHNSGHILSLSHAFLSDG